MMVIDTSALIAILMKEPKATQAAEALKSADGLAISAGTVAEALIVARRRGVGAEMAALIDGLGAEVVPVSLEGARAVADAYDRFGKGAHPAALNFGDCFSYALAANLACPLLYVGDDFARTDTQGAIKGV